MTPAVHSSRRVDFASRRKGGFCLLNTRLHVHAPRGLAEIADAVISGVPHPSNSQEALLERLRGCAKRLASERFQLAVLGQFKRGKSTLLNALIGQPVLATGVLPLTSIPTFLQAGPSFCIKLVHSTGEVAQHQTANLSDLAHVLEDATTEERNPQNRRHLERVEVSIPSRGWLEAVTLIDTPGIGSTHAHNTNAAHRILPECDAALFVLSVDPPITEAELNYLSLVSKTASRIILVLNKVDLVDRSDQERTISFIESVIAKQAEARTDQRIFGLSARAALSARLSGDDEALSGSGLPALEQYVEESLVRRKRELLETSIAAKILAIVERLRDETAISLRALTIPLTDLEEKITAFDQASQQFYKEGERLEDLLTGEWRRTISKLDALCNDAETRARVSLSERLADSLDSVITDANDHLVVKRIMQELFDKELRSIVKIIEDHISTSLKFHQQQYVELVQGVRTTAASLMNTSLSDRPIDEPFQTKREPYWISEARVDSLGAVTLDGIARLLPKRKQGERQRQKLLANAHAAISRNTANLHWATRQNIDDTFRRLLGETAASVALSINATRDLLANARKERQMETDRVQDSVRQTTEALEVLAASRDLLSGRRTPPV
jgi:GTPase SAR1 family protein